MLAAQLSAADAVAHVAGDTAVQILELRARNRKDLAIDLYHCHNSRNRRQFGVGQKPVA